MENKVTEVLTEIKEAVRPRTLQEETEGLFTEDAIKEVRAKFGRRA